MDQFIVSTKSRLEVIDTTLQKQQEMRALTFLVVLLALTIVYEYGGGFIDAWATSGIPTIEEVKAETRVLPARRLERLQGCIDRLVKAHPVLRDRLHAIRGTLASLTTELGQGSRKTLVQSDIRVCLTDIHGLCRQPTWEDPEWFRETVREVESLLTLLKAPPGDDRLPPDLTGFGPRQPTELAPPRRDVFTYASAPLSLEPR